MDRKMAMLAERYLDSSLELDPIQASYVGYHKWDGRLPDYSARGVRRAIHTLEYYASELKKIDRGRLSPAWAIDHELIEAQIAERLFVLKELRPIEWDVTMYSQSVGAGLYYLTVPPEDPAEWPKRLEAIVSRLERLPRYLAQAEKNLAKPPKVFTDFAIASNPRTIDTIEKTLPPLFAGNDALKAKLEKATPPAVEAVRKFQTFLEGPLSERSTGDWRLGRSRWERKLVFSLGSNLSPDAIYEGASHGLDAARFEMYDVALPLYQQMFPDDRSYLEMVGDERINHVVGRVVAEASKEHGTAKSFFADVERIAKDIKAFIRTSGLISLPPPTDKFVVEPTPPFLDGLAVAFYNPAPAFEPDRQKAFWISSVPDAESKDGESYLREYNFHTLKALTIHEAFPGHYVQFYHSSHSPYASVTKRVLESGTMAEGWAVMIEQLMHEAGFSKNDPKARLFHLKMRLRIFINAMIDYRLHTNEGDEAEMDRWALDLMTTKGFQETAEATRKLRRAKLTSTQLSTYYVGYREMLDIYRRAERGTKGSFDKKAFLEKMIGYGTIPPRIIERLLAADGAL